LKEDEELQDDSFIAYLEPDIFNSVTDSSCKTKKPYRQWHILSINSGDDEIDASQDQPDDTNSFNRSQDLTTQPSQTINLWSTQDRDIRLLQHESKELQPILNWREDDNLSETDKKARHVILQSGNFQVVDGLLYHLHYPRTKRLNKIKPVIQQLCVPDVFREQLLTVSHDNSAHIGRERLYETLKQKYYFPYMYTSVIQYVSSCHICQTAKTSPHTRKAPLSSLPILAPFARVHCDHIGPLLKTAEGFQHLLVVVDATTLWCEAFPCKTTTAQETASILYPETIYHTER